jgi:putative oxidoreductase
MRLPDSFVDTWSPRVLSILRIVTGFLFMAHGLQKILDFPSPRATQTVLLSMSGVAGLMELFGGALLLIGLFTRPVSFLLSGEMAFAYFIGHAPQGFWPLLNRGELAALYSFVFLYFAVAGGGTWSLDRVFCGLGLRARSNGGGKLEPTSRRSVHRERLQSGAGG